VISIPLLNMHTPSEIVDERDVSATSKLISALAMNFQSFIKEGDLNDN